MAEWGNGGRYECEHRFLMVLDVVHSKVGKISFKKVPLHETNVFFIIHGS